MNENVWKEYITLRRKTDKTKQEVLRMQMLYEILRLQFGSLI